MYQTVDEVCLSPKTIFLLLGQVSVTIWICVINTYVVYFHCFVFLYYKLLNMNDCLNHNILRALHSGLFFFLPLQWLSESVSWPGIKPRPLTVKAQGPNHWTTREFPGTLDRWVGSVDLLVESTCSEFISISLEVSESCFCRNSSHCGLLTLTTLLNPHCKFFYSSVVVKVHWIVELVSYLRLELGL